MLKEEDIVFCEEHKVKKTFQCDKCHTPMCLFCIEKKLIMDEPMKNLKIIQELCPEGKGNPEVVLQELNQLVDEFDKMRNDIIFLLNNSELSQYLISLQQDLQETFRKIISVKEQENVWKKELHSFFNRLIYSESSCKILLVEYKAFCDNPEKEISKDKYSRYWKARESCLLLNSKLEAYRGEYQKCLIRENEITSSAQESNIFLKQHKQILELKEALNEQLEKIKNIKIQQKGILEQTRICANNYRKIIKDLKYVNNILKISKIKNKCNTCNKYFKSYNSLFVGSNYVVDCSQCRKNICDSCKTHCEFCDLDLCQSCAKKHGCFSSSSKSSLQEQHPSNVVQHVTKRVTSTQKQQYGGVPMIPKLTANQSAWDIPLDLAPVPWDTSKPCPIKSKRKIQSYYSNLGL